MKNLSITELATLQGGGFAAGYCAGIAGVDMLIASAPLAGVALSMSGWGVAWLVGSNVGCAIYAMNR
ncbi:hypothetical protein [Larkinella humicola]|uniref:Uncharacterized protein n=1 Tax=Larkinella humicola TaxID=2607654 RepID=A0A5N1JHH1_9BACT|nr:hypothetical protein [Larkinella humicola]KAA9355159.1 hypothetical protein F0P93_11320 [Larkinella humicola]